MRFCTGTVLEIRRMKEELDALQHRCEALEQQQQTQRLIKFYASVRRTTIDIDQVVEKCRDPTYRQDIFCHRELPVILAHMIAMLDQLPGGLVAMKNVAKVRAMLSAAFLGLTDCPVPQTKEEGAAFRKVLEGVMDTVEPIVQTMALAVLELRKLLTMHRQALNHDEKAKTKLRSLHDVPELQQSLDEFYLAFVQFKFLSLQLLQMSKCPAALASKTPADPEDEEVVGIVDTGIDLLEVARSARHCAELVCNEHHGDCPDIDIEMADSGDDGRAYVSHLPDHLNYILVELIKNSLRATVDTHMQRNQLGMVDCDDMPPVKVRIVTNKSPDTATVVISDQGGGIPREDMEKIMSYTFTSAPKSAHEAQEQEPTLLAGYGYGLPMSRIHARIFGGDILIHSTEGYGTDAYLFLKKKACTLRTKPSNLAAARL
jgi:pyruvate dehydrogenase kinase 2/3/4